MRKRNMGPQWLEYVRQKRHLPFLRRGMVVDMKGERGVITRGNSSGNIQVRFDGQKHSCNCHPTWETTYYDRDGKVIADFKQAAHKEGE